MVRFHHAQPDYIIMQKELDHSNILKLVSGKDKIMAARICQRLGYIPRLTREDKNVLPLTRDLNLQRINLEYDNGIVTNAWIG